MRIVKARRHDKSILPEDAEKCKLCPLGRPSGRLRLVLAGLIAGNLLLISAGAGAAKPIPIIPATRSAEHKVSPYTRANIQRAEALKAAQSGTGGLGQRRPRLTGQMQRF
jgi:hypothetical protein